MSVKEEKSATGHFFVCVCDREGVCSIILYSNENATIKGLDESQLLAKFAYVPHAAEGCGLHRISRNHAGKKSNKFATFIFVSMIAVRIQL